ncbi:MAG TPA: alpha-hydroxy acid oxidase [Streptosporangiaceae bacterium]|nr:alpha-hydroxy acid oxidase [Streptosporangiaceae bacterium]
MTSRIPALTPSAGATVSDLADQGEPAGRPMLAVTDAEQAAAALLPGDVWDFVSGSSGAELTERANRAALDSVFLVPRVLRDVSACRAGTELLGRSAAIPVAIAPMAYQRMIHPDGELGMARAAKAAGVPFTVAMLASETIEQVAAVGADVWLQLYWLKDRAVTLDLVRRAERSGCRALMLTVDVPALGRRLRDLRNGFSFPDGVTPVNLSGESAKLVPAGADGPRGGVADANGGVAGYSAVAAHTAATFDPALSWNDVAWLRDQTDLPLVLKGILDPADARRAADLGVAGIVVSNHGGRQLDGAVPSVTALPWIIDAVGGRCQVLMDGGIRGGTDVLKALALGASGVLLGRPALWGLAAGGAAGATRVLTLLSEEFSHAMVLAGCSDLASVRALRTVTERSQVR